MNSATFVLTHAAKLLLVARSYSNFSSIKKIEFFYDHSYQKVEQNEQKAGSVEQACNLALGRLRLESAQLKISCREKKSKSSPQKQRSAGAESSHWEC